MQHPKALIVEFRSPKQVTTPLASTTNDIRDSRSLLIYGGYGAGVELDDFYYISPDTLESTLVAPIDRFAESTTRVGHAAVAIPGSNSFYTVLIVYPTCLLAYLFAIRLRLFSVARHDSLVDGMARST